MIKIKAFSHWWSFLNSHDLFSWLQINIVRRKLVLVTIGGIKGLLHSYLSYLHSLVGIEVPHLTLFVSRCCKYFCTILELEVTYWCRWSMENTGTWLVWIISKMKYYQLTRQILLFLVTIKITQSQIQVFWSNTFHCHLNPFISHLI